MIASAHSCAWVWVCVRASGCPIVSPPLNSSLTHLLARLLASSLARTTLATAQTSYSSVADPGTLEEPPTSFILHMTESADFGSETNSLRTALLRHEQHRRPEPLGLLQTPKYGDQPAATFRAALKQALAVPKGNADMFSSSGKERDGVGDEAMRGERDETHAICRRCLPTRSGAHPLMARRPTNCGESGGYAWRGREVGWWRERGSTWARSERARARPRATYRALARARLDDADALPGAEGPEPQSPVLRCAHQRRSRRPHRHGPHRRAMPRQHRPRRPRSHVPYLRVRPSRGGQS